MIRYWFTYQKVGMAVHLFQFSFCSFNRILKFFLYRSQTFFVKFVPRYAVILLLSEKILKAFRKKETITIVTTDFLTLNLMQDNNGVIHSMNQSTRTFQSPQVCMHFLLLLKCAHDFQILSSHRNPQKIYHINTFFEAI
jgi:hypothetical protein